MDNTVTYFAENFKNALSENELKSLEGNTTTAPYSLFKWGYAEGVKKATKDLEEGIETYIVDILSDYAKELKGLELTIKDLEDATHYVGECQLYMIEKNLERITKEINNYILEIKEPTPTTDQVQE